MYDIDYMLNGKQSRERHQEMIREAELEHRARKVAQGQRKPNSGLRAMLVKALSAFTG